MQLFFFFFSILGLFPEPNTHAPKGFCSWPHALKEDHIPESVPGYLPSNGIVVRAPFEVTCFINIY